MGNMHMIIPHSGSVMFATTSGKSKPIISLEVMVAHYAGVFEVGSHDGCRKKISNNA
jgi:hypothetical protein